MVQVDNTHGFLLFVEQFDSCEHNHAVVIERDTPGWADQWRAIVLDNQVRERQ